MYLSGLSSLCHSYGFDYQQRVLKTFPGPGWSQRIEWSDYGICL